MAKPKFDYDLIVIGGGPAGLLTAEMSARHGKSVAIIEQAILGGSAPTVGDLPMQALLTAAHAFDDAHRAAHLGIRTNTVGYNYPSIINWKNLAVKRSGVSSTGDYLRGRGIAVFKGRAHFLSPNEVSIGRRHLSAEKFLIATGATPSIPSIPGLDKVEYLTPHTAIDLLRPPKTLLIIGAGPTGVQLAELFSIFGTKVYLLEAKKHILPKQDEEVSSALADIFRNNRGIDIITSASVSSIKKEGPLLTASYLSGEHQHSVKVEKVLLATGWSPNVDIGLENAEVEYTRSGVGTNAQLVTSNKNIFTAGAVTGRCNSTQMALAQSRVAANNLWSRSLMTFSETSIPRVIWTTPEIATVGFNETDLVRENEKFRSIHVDNSATTRANVMNFGFGFAKVITDTKGVIIGATIMAPHAAESIGIVSVAIQNGLTAGQLADMTPAFGSWTETLKIACAKLRV